MDDTGEQSMWWDSDWTDLVGDSLMSMVAAVDRKEEKEQEKEKERQTNERKAKEKEEAKQRSHLADSGPLCASTPKKAEKKTKARSVFDGTLLTSTPVVARGTKQIKEEAVKEEEEKEQEKEKKEVKQRSPFKEVQKDGLVASTSKPKKVAKREEGEEEEKRKKEKKKFKREQAKKEEGEKENSPAGNSSTATSGQAKKRKQKLVSILCLCGTESYECRLWDGSSVGALRPVLAKHFHLPAFHLHRNDGQELHRLGDEVEWWEIASAGFVAVEVLPIKQRRKKEVEQRKEQKKEQKVKEEGKKGEKETKEEENGQEKGERKEKVEKKKCEKDYKKEENEEEQAHTKKDVKEEKKEKKEQTEKEKDEKPLLVLVVYGERACELRAAAGSSIASLRADIGRAFRLDPDGFHVKINNGEKLCNVKDSCSVRRVAEYCSGGDTAVIEIYEKRREKEEEEEKKREKEKEKRVQTKASFPAAADPRPYGAKGVLVKKCCQLCSSWEWPPHSRRHAYSHMGAKLFSCACGWESDSVSEKRDHEAACDQGESEEITDAKAVIYARCFPEETREKYPDVMNLEEEEEEKEGDKDEGGEDSE